MSAARAGVALAVSALAIAACGSSGSKSSATSHSTSGGTTTSSSSPAITSADAKAIEHAATLSASAPGERVAFTLAENSSALGQLAVSGTGSFNNSPTEGQLMASLTSGSSSAGGELAEVAAALGNSPLHLVEARNVAYLQVPSSLSALVSSYTHNKPWLALDLGQLSKSSGFGSILGAIFGGQGGLTNPAQSLEELEAVGTGDVEKVGPATVGGVATTHYRAIVPTSKLESLLASKGAQASQLLAQVKASHAVGIPYNVWVDGSGRIRQVNFTAAGSVDGVTIPIAVQTEFLAYGKQAAPTVPPASQTASIAPLLSALG